MTPESLLRQYYGHSSFRPGQKTIIDKLVGGGDALAVMPTGAGKSLCYQIPALMLPGVTIVISPLISLMKDQVSSLIQMGIPAAYINSSLTARQVQTAMQRACEGRYRIIYIAPERLENESLDTLVRHVPISLLAVDEAHCVSQWGQDFRPSYLKIREFIKKLPVRPAVGAFTATATGLVQEDIVKLLELDQPCRVITGFDRVNLYFDVVSPSDKLAYTLNFIQRRKNQSGIIYCGTRKTVENVCQALQQQGLPATRYHAGLDEAERHSNQDDFVFDRTPIMVATNAFGMGIDKSNVNYVLHYNMPKDLESYYQEAGRAGRDGEKADCILLFSQQDVALQKFFIAKIYENQTLSDEEKERLSALETRRLEAMVNYCVSEDCLRGQILRYFGEEYGDRCGNCGRCNATYRQEDITKLAHSFMACVAHIERNMPYGLGLMSIISIVTGKNSAEIQSRRLNDSIIFGAMRSASPEKLRSIAETLLNKGYLARSEGRYPTIHLTDEGRRNLVSNSRITRRAIEKKPSARARKRASYSAPNERLVQKLRDVRLQLAQKAHVPAFIIFSDAALKDIAVRRPMDVSEFLECTGVGERKAALYGRAFVGAVREFIESEKA
ncbi:MAG: DNA helicase RecQ [Clostridia bacterium]|nr:DNA helicase RecQ [Clostridia bacterium]